MLTNYCPLKQIIPKIQVNIWNIIYLNCRESQEDMINHRSYAQNLSSCEIKARKKLGLNGIWTKTSAIPSAAPYQLSYQVIIIWKRITDPRAGHLPLTQSPNVSNKAYMYSNKSNHYNSVMIGKRVARNSTIYPTLASIDFKQYSTLASCINWTICRHWNQPTNVINIDPHIQPMKYEQNILLTLERANGQIKPESGRIWSANAKV